VFTNEKEMTPGQNIEVSMFFEQIKMPKKIPP
jgi:hypothetical protein